MKRFSSYLLIFLAALAFPAFASADVAGIGTIIVFGLLPYVLIAAVVIVAVVILVKVIRKKHKPDNNGKEK